MNSNQKFRLKEGVKPAEFLEACEACRATNGTRIAAQVLVSLGVDRNAPFHVRGNKRIRLKRMKKLLRRAVLQTVTDLIEVVE